MEDQNKNTTQAAQKEASSSSESTMPKTATPKKEAEKKPEYNTAIVYDGKREIRRYTVEIHGSVFADKAEEFAMARKYQVEYKNAKPMIACPSCGHRFDPK